jgi:hypothetical protein
MPSKAKQFMGFFATNGMANYTTLSIPIMWTVQYQQNSVLPKKIIHQKKKRHNILHQRYAAVQSLPRQKVEGFANVEYRLTNISPPQKNKNNKPTKTAFAVCIM